MIVSLKGYITEQIDSSGALQNLIKYARPLPAKSIVTLAYRYESIYTEGVQISEKVEERTRTGPLNTPILPIMVRESKVKESRYTPENIAKEKTEDRVMSDQESIGGRGKIREKEASGNFGKDVKRHRVLAEEGKGGEVRSEPSIKKQEDIVFKHKGGENDGDEERKVPDVHSLTSRSEPVLKVDDETDYAQSSEVNGEANQTNGIPLKVPSISNDDLFKGLIKNKPKTQADKLADITVPGDFLSKINAKIYECISELQLENMRAKSNRVQNTISTLESLRSQIFKQQSESKGKIQQ